MEAASEQQRAICRVYGADFVPAPDDKKLGFAANLYGPLLPINGLRRPPDTATTGWFLWGGTDGPSPDPDFLAPLHTSHVVDIRPEIVQYLGLAPGWRFLIAPGHVDVWYDPELLKI